jgi:hypothetical protein
MSIRHLLIPALLIIAQAPLLSFADTPDATAEEIKAAKPKRVPRFHILFSMGYGSEDGLPRNPAEFEAWITTIKAGHFTAVMCNHEPWKEEICRKHGIKMLINLLSHKYHHVYKNTEKTAMVCKGLRNNDAILGYHLWSDKVGGMAAGRDRDVNNCHTWDPTHPTYVGVYKTHGLHAVKDPDSLGFYNFHWKRGRHRHYRALRILHGLAKERDCGIHRWIETDAGLIGRGNPNRCGFTASTSMVFGLKGVWWFIGSRLMRGGKWTGAGKDIVKVNGTLVKLGPEVDKIGIPSVVYATATTKDMNDRDKKPDPPGGLPTLPKDFWAQVLSGESLVGVYKHEDGSDVLFFGNPNSYQPQKMAVKLAGAKSVRLLDRETGKYKELELKDGVVEFEMPPACCELLKIAK